MICWEKNDAVKRSPYFPQLYSMYIKFIEFTLIHNCIWFLYNYVLELFPEINSTCQDLNQCFKLLYIWYSKHISVLILWSAKAVTSIQLLTVWGFYILQNHCYVGHTSVAVNLYEDGYPALSSALEMMSVAIRLNITLDGRSNCTFLRAVRIHCCS